MPRKPTRGVRRLPPSEDPFSAHEALDRAHLAPVFFDEHVSQLPFARTKPTLRRAAERLAGGLADFYQAVGAERFGIDRGETVVSRGRSAAALPTLRVGRYAAA